MRTLLRGLSPYFSCVCKDAVEEEVVEIPAGAGAARAPDAIAACDEAGARPGAAAQAAIRLASVLSCAEGCLGEGRQ
eukprot:CAMPEP_0203932762 /NCGR_PEP_ID=MMETSP0359-20131031/71079_1 /ASSEMBLY_ACC=CAM_ASM_000338 /TAXON_ID=268821 /ORGANISM="Scrippsiella Hangoei, Strain SHTV-5" /LENGTH=76 /DNA_ID=CAMNT_0050862239 /DNA_START=168 /DNA_END=395 /DNA_ORIENTATION=-